MSPTIDDRMQSIEDQLKELRRELEEGLSRYRASGVCRVGGLGMQLCIDKLEETETDWESSI